MSKVNSKADVGRFLGATFSRGQPLRIELRQRGVTGDSAVVESWVREQWEALKMSPSQIGDEILERADDDAKAFRGVQTYTILIYRDERQDASGRHQFRVEGRLTIDGIEESEPATEKGYLGAIMRHADGKDRLANRLLEGLIASQDRRLERAEHQVDRLLEKHFDVIQLVESLVDRREQRAVEVMKEKNTVEFQNNIMKKVSLLFPVLGDKLLPEAGFDKLQMASLLESLTPPQIDRMMAMFSKEQSAAFMKIVLSKGQDGVAVAKLIEGLTDDQYQQLMAGILSPEQVGVLGTFYESLVKKAQAEAAKKEGEAAPKAAE